jgi:hypothetical protein
MAIHTRLRRTPPESQTRIPATLPTKTEPEEVLALQAAKPGCSRLPRGIQARTLRRSSGRRTVSPARSRWSSSGSITRRLVPRA